jgi:sugar phosphate isomerase/epimerase
MKLGVMTVLLSDMLVEDAFKYLNSLGVQMVEIGCGGYPGDSHLKPEVLLNNPDEVVKFKNLLEKYNLQISALSVHGNPVHPNKEIATNYHNEFIEACKLAQVLNVDTVNTFSGCPGDSETSKLPNWVTCSWPNEYSEILKYQWDDVLIPYWKETVKIAAKYGVTKIALEMHPGFCVYNPSSLLKLRNAVGDAIGTNFDPSHLFWQGIKPAEAIKALKGAIYHFHAKDTKIDVVNTNINGVLDTSDYTNILERSWVFRTVGYGSDYAVWKEIMSALAATGYDGAISIEHEDGLMSVKEGLEKAVAFLKEVIIFDKPGASWWI